MEEKSGVSTIIPVEKLGPAGMKGQLTVLPISANEPRTDKERLSDRSMREFHLKATFSKNPAAQRDISFDLKEDDGHSYFLIPEDQVAIRIRAPQGMIDIHKNKNHEQSLAIFSCTASTVADARSKFQDLLLPFLDHQSYIANCPIFLSTIRTEDPKNGSTSIDYVSPYRNVTISPHLKSIAPELLPVYAMYRDAKNSQSSFYSFLCYHKILEGLLGSMRKNLRDRATEKKLSLSSRRDLVPTSDQIHRDHAAWQGKSVKSFVDGVMTPQFRNAVAHFITNDGAVLNLSAPQEMRRYDNIGYVSELCVRVVIETHEAWLGEIGAHAA